MSEEEAVRSPSGFDRSRLAIFSKRDARPLDETGMMTYERTDDVADYSRRVLDAGILDGTVVEQLFRHEGPDGFSLATARFKPNFPLARHSHDCDCMYYVVSGSLRLGSRVLGAGDGFFVPKDKPYGYIAGPEGAEVLEFRHATDFTFTMRESPAGKERIINAVIEHHPTWSTSGEAAPRPEE